MEERTVSGVHPVELCVYSVLSSDLDELYHSINQLRESEAFLILSVKKIRDSLKKEHRILYEKELLRKPLDKLKTLQKRMDILLKRYEEIKRRNKKLIEGP
ncbi:Snn1p NDAI_0F02530 [Naumovozyma dairenensis CBS 421]|uniref:Biogenesis of lysosome-related organelles complex 1 subunit SNN1 n=1 Tax=Naumovozyma dairenensis (strain ATCC 10597 / BCRC 20456 / CBS 421 / NBRC 0211 / NRRL Y-12639) TaxID=1071378 RepID=G0WCR0_NAUDC|nr:hypothetical protein NDAI_0F02530 [Naumovozyma dairenensis CBS 421]CCD25571.1 hypothetical protein NDAI_0F02530 [Naumovozyma dairenensis CBS 421]